MGKRNFGVMFSAVIAHSDRQRSTADLLTAGNFTAVLGLGDHQYPSGALADLTPTTTRPGDGPRPRPIPR
jgi:hypothetical protein